MRRLAVVPLALPPLVALVYIHTFGVNGAHWDHLTSAEIFDRYQGGQLTLEFLFRPHLEHVKVLPRLVCLGLGLASGFNNLVEMTVQWLLLCGATIVLIRALRGRTTWRGAALLVASAPIALALFNLRQHESMLTGDGMITYMGIAFVVLTIALVAKAESLTDVAAAAVAAIAACLSHASGLLLWPIGLSVLLAPRALPAQPHEQHPGRVPALALWVCAAVATMTFCLWRIERAGGGPGHILQDPGGALRYYVAASGVTFAANPRFQQWTGAVVMAVELLVGACSLARLRAGGRLPFGLWLMLFAAGCRLLWTAGRPSDSFNPFVPSRYAAFVALATAGAYLAALEIEQQRPRGRRWLTAITLSVIVMSWTTGSREGWRSGPVEHDTRTRIIQLLESAPLQTDATLERWLYPNAAHARAYADALRRLHLNVFARPLADPDRLPRSNGARARVDAIGGLPVPRDGLLDVSETDAVSIAGWALDERAGRPLERMVLQIDGTMTIPIAYGLHRPDVAAEFQHPQYLRTGFESVFAARALTPGEHALTLLLVTADGARVVISDPMVRLRRR